MTVSLRNCVTVCVCVCTKTGINHHSLCRPLSVLVFLSFLFQRKVLFSSESLGDENMHTDRWRRKEKEKRKRVQIWLCLLMAKGTEKVEVCVCVWKSIHRRTELWATVMMQRGKGKGEKKEEKKGVSEDPKWNENATTVQLMKDCQFDWLWPPWSPAIISPSQLTLARARNSPPLCRKQITATVHGRTQSGKMCVCVLLTGTREKQSEWMSEWVSESLQFPFLLPVAVVYPSPKCFLGLLYY